MDEIYRFAERDSHQGDALATRRLALLERRRGTPNRVLERLTLALAQNPASEEIQKEYRESGGFWIERTHDEALGDSFRYENLDFRRQRVTFVRKNECEQYGWLTRDQCRRARSTTAELEYTIRAHLHAYQNHPALAQPIKEAISTLRLDVRTSAHIILGTVFTHDGALHLEEQRVFGSSGQHILPNPAQVPPGRCHFLLCDCPSHRTGNTSPAYLHSFLRELLGERYQQGLTANRDILTKPGQHLPLTLTLPPLQEITEAHEVYRLVGKKGMTSLCIEGPPTFRTEGYLARHLIRPILLDENRTIS